MVNLPYQSPCSAIMAQLLDGMLIMLWTSYKRMIITSDTYCTFQRHSVYCKMLEPQIQCSSLDPLCAGYTDDGMLQCRKYREIVAVDLRALE